MTINTPLRPGHKQAHLINADKGNAILDPHTSATGRSVSRSSREDAENARNTNSRPKQKSELRRIFRLFKNYRSALAFVGGLIVVSALVSLATPFLLRHILDVSLPDRNTGLTLLLAGGMIAVAIGTSVLDVIQSRQSTIVGQKVMHDLRTGVYSHLQKLSLGFFTKTRTGEVQARIASDIGSMQAVVTNTATSIVSSGTTVIATFVAMLVLDWKLTLVSLVLLPLFVWISRRVGAMRREIATARQERMADMSSMVAESLSVSGVLLSKTMGRSAELSQRFSTTSADLADLEIRSAMTGRWRQSTIGIIVSILPAAIYVAFALTISGTTGPLSIGTLVAFTTLQGQLFRPMVGLLRTGVEMQTSLAMFRRVFDYLDIPIDISETENPASVGNLKGHLRFDDVTFRYPGTDSAVVSNITLDIPVGSHVALVGATGSGKTTLGYLATRLYEPDSGVVTLDGIPLADMAFTDLAASIGIVSQETYLLHTNIAENLRFAKPEATDEEIIEAAKGAQIHDLISSLPDGYQTVVGERGYRFSGGEKQRLAIARIILRNPPVLILDEATSALDTRTETAVTQALESLAAGRTTLTIAHRLSTIADADLIAVVDHGRIVERGTHDELVASGGRYAALLAGASV